MARLDAICGVYAVQGLKVGSDAAAAAAEGSSDDDQAVLSDNKKQRRSSGSTKASSTDKATGVFKEVMTAFLPLPPPPPSKLTFKEWAVQIGLGDDQIQQIKSLLPASSQGEVSTLLLASMSDARLVALGLLDFQIDAWKVLAAKRKAE